MEQETLFTAAKWNLLKALATSPKSPMELADEAKTSVSNISQSLRFLELAGIVNSERVSNRDKGLPRVMYSLNGDNAYIIATSNNFVEKKQIALDIPKKIRLRIWFYENKSFHPYLEKAIDHIENHIENLEGIYFDTTSNDMKIILLAKDSKSKKEIKEISVDYQGASRKIKFSYSEASAIKSAGSNYYTLYDPKNTRGAM